MLYNEEETSTSGILNDNVEDIVQEMSYEEVLFCYFEVITHLLFIL